MPFHFTPFREIPEVVLVEPVAFEDERGWFIETYRYSDFAAFGIAAEFVQDDHSANARRGTLRGLHYQKSTAAQGKLVRCVAGEIFDVAVDIRRGAPTYARHVSTILSAANRRILWIPPGFAHGFLALSDGAEVAYKHTSEYRPEHARHIRWDDPALGIPWPLGDTRPLLSREDVGAPLLADADNDFTWDEHRHHRP